MPFDDYRDAYLKDIRGERDQLLAGCKIALGITASIAAIECPRLVRELMRHGADVHVCMSRAAARLVTADALQWASGNPVITRLTGWVEHLYLSGEWEGAADLLLIAPATANTVGKMAHGIDDTVVTTVATSAIGAGQPIVVAPGMHACMARHPAFLKNLDRLRRWGVIVVDPQVAEGKAKMAPLDDIVMAVVRRLGQGDLAGRHVLITAGPTVEYLDPVRVITNLSSGKMGVALARAALDRGARVTLVYGPGTAAPPVGAGLVRVVTTAEMLRAVEDAYAASEIDVSVFAAAVCDYQPAAPQSDKMATRNGNWTVELQPTPKIIETARRLTRGVVVGFKAETVAGEPALLACGREALRRSGADLTVLNRVGDGLGFMADENEVYVLGASDEAVHLPRADKTSVAHGILDAVVSVLSSHRQTS